MRLAAVELAGAGYQVQSRSPGLDGSKRRRHVDIIRVVRFAGHDGVCQHFAIASSDTNYISRQQVLNRVKDTMLGRARHMPVDESVTRNLVYPAFRLNHIIKLMLFKAV